jgi:hypothetical protein
MKFRYKEYIQIPKADWEFFRSNMEFPMYMWLNLSRDTGLERETTKDKLEAIKNKDYKIIKL